MYRTILVPTDGSDGAQRAIQEAVSLADLTGATVHGLYVVDTRDYNTLPESKWVSLQDELRAEGERALDAVQAAAEDADVAVETAVVRGVPHEEILDYAADHDADLLVMGTHGRTGFDHFLLGSVTEKVVRRSPVPVHVVRLDD
ncbi:MAG: universal stress protein [Halobacteriaceae archaeon]